MNTVNPTLVIFQGLPGSGKSTLALKLLEDLGDSGVRVNRDDLRTEVAGEKYHTRSPRKDVEKKVTELQNERLTVGLRNNKTVITDDTNLNTRTLRSLVVLADKYNAEIEFIPVDVPVETALERNKKRGANGGRFVPEFVIKQMADRAYSNGHLKKFVIDPRSSSVYAVPQYTREQELMEEFNTKLSLVNPAKSTSVVLVDCDGTLANNAHHAAYAFGRGKKKDYDFFYHSIAEAPVNTRVRDLVNKYYGSGYTVFMLTGRSNGAAAELIKFVEASGAKLSRVISKDAGDNRPDFAFKGEVLEALTNEGLHVVAAIDDRPRSINTWEKNGIHVDRVDFVDPVYDPDNTGPRDEPFVNSPFTSGICTICWEKNSNKNGVHAECL